ncbi:YbbR domain-containing protein [Selenomonas sp. GACV-9]|uniref:CdaR family protein n=1 Tax=Selenomonas sp. GACV-9 TaxID=3158782 RepID=UPI0008F2D922|nr:YbbR domain-containing protein [Selenomonas ruminantium]
MISTFRHMIQHNLAAKIIALVVAVVLWGYVMNDQNPAIEGSYTVQIQLKNVPDGYKISQSSMTVKIKVRGARSLFVNSAAEDFKAYVDLKDAENGKHSYKVHVDTPQGFEVADENPGTIDVTLDRIIDREVRATINVNGVPAPGVTVAKVNQASAKVIVTGPESAVNEVDRVIGYIGLNGNNDKDFSLQVPLTPINADGREVQGVTVSPTTMYVTVQMARGLRTKIVTVKPALTGSLNSELELVSVKVEPVKIEIAGDESKTGPVTALSTEPISLDEITKNTDRTVKLILPDGVTVTNQDATVHIVVKAKEEK